MKRMNAVLDRRPRLFLAAALILAGCGGAQKPAEEPVAGIPSDPTLLLPAECTAGLHLDVASLRGSSYYRERRAELTEGLEPGERRIVEYFLEHTRSLAVGFTFEGRKEKQRPHWVIVAEGDFKQVGLLAFVAEMAGAGEMKGLKKPEPVGAGEEGRYLEFFADKKRRGLILDERTVVFGDRKFLPRVLALVSDPEARRFVDTDLYRRMGPLAGFGKSTLAAVSAIPGNVADRIRRGSDSGSLFAKYEEAVQGITAVGARLDLKGGMTLDLVAETASADYPPRLTEIANALMFAARLAQEDRNVHAIIDGIVIRTEGLRVHLRLQATDEQIAAIVALAREKQEEEEGAESEEKTPESGPSPNE